LKSIKTSGLCFPEEKSLLQERKKNDCIGRESNPGLAETVMATANFTTKPPMLIR
jgi:hypothetical protein